MNYIDNDEISVDVENSNINSVKISDKIGTIFLNNYQFGQS